MKQIRVEWTFISPEERWFVTEQDRHSTWANSRRSDRTSQTWYTPLVEVNQAIISLVVLDKYSLCPSPAHWDSRLGSNVSCLTVFSEPVSQSDGGWIVALLVWNITSWGNFWWPQLELFASLIKLYSLRHISFFFLNPIYISFPVRIIFTYSHCQDVGNLYLLSKLVKWTLFSPL